MHKVYIGLGGNIGDTALILREALSQITQIPAISSLRESRFYQTKPVGVETNQDFINAACHFQTHLDPEALYHELAKIESALGKVPKAKNISRILDLDILFFGELRIQTSLLTIPHPCWKKRLFVLQPLSDLAQQLRVPDEEGHLHPYNLSEMIEQFENTHGEVVIPLQ